MRLNDELGSALEALERRKILNLLGPFSGPAPTSRSSPTTHHEPTETSAFARRTTRAPSRRKTACRSSPPCSRSTTPPERKGGDTPITVKASHELAQTLVTELKKGVAFVVEGELAYYKSPETNRETYSIWADNFTDITPPKSTAAKAG